MIGKWLVSNMKTAQREGRSHKLNSTRASARLGGLTLIEVMVAILIISVGVLGTMGYRYYSVLNANKAEVRVTATGLASMLLNSWKGSGGYSGYTEYAVDDTGENPDEDFLEYDPEYDYVPYNPADYDYDADESTGMEFGSGFTVNLGAPGSAVPDGFSPLDAECNPNYRFVADDVNYYATLSYKDEAGQPRLLNVRVAWMNDYQTWSDSGYYQSVTLTTYASD